MYGFCTASFFDVLNQLIFTLYYKYGGKQKNQSINTSIGTVPNEIVSFANYECALQKTYTSA